MDVNFCLAKTMAKLISWLAKNQDMPKYGGKLDIHLVQCLNIRLILLFSLIKKVIVIFHDLVINIEVPIF